MKVYIEDQSKISVFSLPSKIEDEFIINYISPQGIEENITLTSENNCWNISSGYDYTFYEGQERVISKALEDGSFFKIKFNDIENLVNLYSFNIPITYYNFTINNLSEITIGNSDSNIICYNKPEIATQHIKISKVNNYWLLDDLNQQERYVYVNQKRVHKCYLQLGDIIFVNGLKIIWMDSYISINKPNNLIKIKLQEYQKYDIENTYTPVNDVEKNATLYTEKQIFFHTPRLKQNIKGKIIKIENPPAKEPEDEIPAFITYGATVMMGVSSSITGVIAISNIVAGKATILSSITEIGICITMMLGMILFPILQDKFQKKKKKEKEAKRQKRYGEYLNNKREEINNELKEENEILFKNNLSSEELQNAINNLTTDIWSREILDDDFLNIRLGLGDIEAFVKVDAALEEFSLEDDNLREEVKKIKDEKLMLKNVPITISLTENNILPIIISDDYLYKKQYLDWLSLQLITYYSGIDLKIAILTTEENKDYWDFYKYLPHCQTPDRKLRLFATDEEQYKDIAFYLDEQYKLRLINSND